MGSSGVTVGGAYAYDNAGDPWSLTSPDAATLRFQVRPGDIPADVAASGSATEESVATFATPIMAGVPFDINFNITLAPGGLNNASYLVLAQLNQALSTGPASNPPFDIDLVNDQMVIYIRYQKADGTIASQQIYADPTSIVRGQSYNIDIKATFDAAGAGRLVVTRNGVTLADYAGPLGYTGDQPLTWQEGLRRGSGSTQTLSADYSGLSITSGPSVQFNAPVQFLAAPNILLDTISRVTGTTAYAVALHGTAPGSTVSLYDNGVFVGSATPDSYGNYSAVVNVQSQGAHTLYAVSSNSAGVTSTASYASTFKVGVAGDPAQVQPGNFILDTNSGTYWVQNASKSWSISEPDVNTIRFEVRSHDVAYYDLVNFRTANRSEIAGEALYSNGVPLELAYQFNLEPGSPNTAYFMVLGQLHQDTYPGAPPWGPPFDIGLQGERMTIDIKYSDANGNPVNLNLFTDNADIQRGHYYDIDIKIIVDPSGGGRLVVTRDGVTIVDYSGPLGYVQENGVYWKEGIYRNSNATETIAADYRNLTITTGSGVNIPPPSEFIAAPVLGVGSVAAPAPDGSRAFTIQGTAKIGTTVAIMQNGIVVGTGVVNSSGAFSAQVVLVGTGEFLLTGVATDATGRNGLTASPMAIEIGTSANIVSRMDAIQANQSVGAIVLTDTSVLTVSSLTQMSTLRGHDANALSKIQGQYSFLLVQTFTGKSYDTQTSAYTSAGVLFEVIRYSKSIIVYDQKIAADGSQTTYSVNTNGSYGVTSNSPTGATIEADLFTATNILYSKDQRFADGSRLVSTFSQTTGQQTGYTQYNADKSYKVVTLNIAGQPYTTQAVSYNIAGKQVLQERFTANGTKILSSSTSATGVLQTQNFNATTGLLTSYSITNPDGTTVQATFGIAGQSYSGQVLSYDKSKNLSEKDLLDANGKLLSMDTWLVNQWHRVFVVASGVTTGYTQINTDNSKSIVTFAAGISGQLASVNIYNPAGTLIETDLYNSTGQKISANLFSSNGSLLTAYDPVSGLATGTTQTNTDKSMTVTLFVVGMPGKTASVSTYNASGVLIETDLYIATGQKTLATVFGINGTRVATTYDPASGLATGYTQFNADGSSSAALYAVGMPGQLASVNLFNPAGTLVETDLYNSSGQQISATQYSVSPAPVVSYDPVSGIATGFTLANADGSQTVASYATGLPGQLAKVLLFSSTGALVETDLFNAAGKKISADVLIAGSGDLLTNYDPSSGLATGTTQTNSDSSKSITVFASGLPGQLASVNIYNSAGTLIETDLYNAAGKKISVDVFTTGAGDLLTSIDPSSGLATGATQTNANRSRTVTVYAAGTPGQIASVNLYNSAGTLVETDLYNSVGTKISTDVFTAGAGDLLTAYDPSSNLATGYTQTNFDGSKSIAVYATGVPGQLASVGFYNVAGTLTETDLYNASGMKISSNVYHSDGTNQVTTFDPTAGLATGYTQFNLDGSQVVGTYVTGNPGQLASVSFYNAAGTLTETDIYSAGAKISSDVFTPGTGDLLTSFDPTSGLATGSTKTNADGSKSVSIFAAGLPGQLASVNAYNPAGVLIETDLYNSSGNKISSDVFRADGSNLFVTYNAQIGLPTYISQNNADGSHVVTVYAGIALGQTVNVSTYNAANVLTEYDVYNYNSKRVSSQIFANGGNIITYYDVMTGVATSVTQTNSDKSVTVTNYAAGLPGQVQTFYSYNTVGAPVETDLYNVAGQKTSVDLFAADGSQLITTYDPVSGRAKGTTQIAAGGARIVSVYAPGLPGQLASVTSYNANGVRLEVDLFNALGKQISADAFAVTGGDLLTVLDPTSGLATGTILTNIDGSSVVSVFAAGIPGQLASVTSYNTAGVLIEIDLYNAVGTKISTDIFTVGSGDLLTTLDPNSGLATGTTQTKSDGSKVVSVFANGKPGQLASVLFYSSAGALIETDLYNAGGQRISADVPMPGGGDMLTTLDPSSGLATGTTQTNADKSKTVSVYAAGLPGQLASVTLYNSAGTLTELDLYNATGQKISSDVFTAGAGDLFTTYDPVSGLSTGYTQTNADGSKSVATYMAGSFSQLASLNAFNPAGTLIAATLWNSDGSRKVYAFKSAGVENGYTVFRLDGSKTVATFAPGNEALLMQVTVYDPTGFLMEVDSYNTTGIKITGDVRSATGLHSVYTYDPTSGVLTQYTITNPDKSRTEVNLAITGKSYTQQSASYSASGAIVSMIRWYGDVNHTVAFTQVIAADSSAVVHNYDTSARETVRQIINADGSKDTYVFTYGASTAATPVTVQQDRYNTSNVKIWTDITNTDGTHSTTAYAAGVTITASTGVVSTLTSSSAGSDTFVFKPAFGQDIITNFHAGDASNHDILDLTAYNIQFAPGQSSAAYLAQALTQVGKDAILSISSTDSLRIKNTQVASITSSDYRV